MTFRLVVCRWDAKEGVLKPAPRFGNVAAAQFVDGEEYPMEVREHRSSAEHAHYFASINEAWHNLNEETLQALKTPEHLRKWCLIEGGWYEETMVDCGSRDRAMRMATFARKLDDYAEIKIIREGETWLLRIREAKSQSRAAMNKEEFRASKRDVLDILSGAIHVTRRDLERAGKVSHNG